MFKSCIHSIDFKYTSEMQHAKILTGELCFGGEPIIMSFRFISKSICNWKQKKKNGESCI